MRNINSSNPSRFACVAATGAALVVTAAGMLATGGTASATPSTLGAFPSTDVYPQGTFHLDVDTYGQALRGNGLTSTGLTYGFGSDTDKAFGRNEIGFDYLWSIGGMARPNGLYSGTPISSTDKLTFNAKTQLFSDSAGGTRVVAGIWGLGNKQVGQPQYLYLLGSKTFSFGRIHAGVETSLAKKATIAAPSGEADKTSLHLAYDRALTPKLSFAIDWCSGKNAWVGTQPTLYYAVNDKASFGIGLMHFNDSTVLPTRNQVYACFDYNFDFKGAEAK